MPDDAITRWENEGGRANGEPPDARPPAPRQQAGADATPLAAGAPGTAAATAGSSHGGSRTG
jgi:hypothetical protein